MDKENIAQLKNLVSLFEDRDKLYQRSTEKILTAVGPTALEALYVLFDTPYENVSWLEVQLIENILLLVASINYEDSQKVPDVIQALSPVPEDGRASIRLFRVGLPVELVFKSKEEIVDYLAQTAGIAARKAQERKEAIEHQDDNVVPVRVANSQPEFDTSELTHEQIQQLLIFGSDTKGTKH